MEYSLKNISIIITTLLATISLFYFLSLILSMYPPFNFMKIGELKKRLAMFE